VIKLAGRLRSFLDSLTQPEPTPASLSLNQLMTAAESLYGPIAEHAGVHLEFLSDAPFARSVSDGHAALVILTALLSLALRVTERGGKVELKCTTSGDAALFELAVPALTPPRTHIDSVEPPDPLEIAVGMPFQVLSACSSMASRLAGQVTIEAAGTGSIVRFRCPPLSTR
jgi:signal transduction histidine kinase